MISKIAGLAMDDFIRLYDEEGPFELIEGERVTVSPTMFGHVSIIKRVLDLLAPHSSVGEAFPEAPFVTVPPEDPNWVKGSRVPDVMFVRAERLTAYKQANPHWRDLPLALVPDLVVEIVSPLDRYTDINTKVERYLADGVLVVWVIDPQRRAIAVHETGKNQFTRLAVGQILSGGQVIPGLEIPVSSLFD
jgi:Uma2 family endonuclease